MKNILLIILSVIAINAYGQAPDGVNYQAVVRDNLGAVIVSSPIGMKLSIYEVSTATTPIYEESFTPTTNAYGLVNLILGEGVLISGDFPTITWTNGPYFMEVSADVTGGTSYASLGFQKLKSVPFALYAKNAENVFSGDYNDLSNQPTIPTNTSDLVNDSGFITSPDDADSDPTNEYNTGVSLSGTTLTITDTGGDQTIDLSPLQDGVNDADADPLNEIQTLSIAGDQITLSDGGGTVQLEGPVQENTGSRSYICSGNTTPGIGWTVFSPTTITLSIVTNGCGYSSSARYFTSVQGSGSQYVLTGTTAIYAASPTGFTIYARHVDGSPLTPADATANGWYINWVSIGN
ncbi:MAG: hypothetical protein ACI837_001103 [Crocinitomicaceae bacterium]|jgi:hypothetical protein